MYQQAIRIRRMVDFLGARRYGATRSQLMNQFDVGERQLRRDLALLKEEGYALDDQESDEGRRILLRDGPRRALSLTLRERYTMLAMSRVFDVLRGTPFYEDVHGIWDKIAASLPSQEREDLDRFGGRFLCLPDGGTKAYHRKQDVLDALLTGVLHRLRVQYRYRASGGKIHDGLLEPYAVVLYKNGLYVIGRGGLAPDDSTSVNLRPRVFAAERFLRAKHLRGVRFDPPRKFSIDDFFEGAFGIFAGEQRQRVVVDFSADVRAHVEARIWHPRQHVSPLRNGGVRLSFEISNLTQVPSWILSWGPHAQVREPEALRQEVRDQLVKAAHQAIDPADTRLQSRSGRIRGLPDSRRSRRRSARRGRT